jgi:catechol 2,3-dioxygenase-like lactoylglutathione lyase family enzyme
MQLGAFSISLAVKDIQASLRFYSALGFSVVGGDPAQNWLILRNKHHTIGLFQGMFDNNMLTFNPGWDEAGEPLSTFTDIREIQSTLIEAGLELEGTAEQSASGPASCLVIDPDGNPILIDQHV